MPDIWSREKTTPPTRDAERGSRRGTGRWGRRDPPPAPGPACPGALTRPGPCLQSRRDHQEFPNVWSCKVLDPQKSDGTPMNPARRLTCRQVFTCVSALSYTCVHSLCCWREAHVGACCSHAGTERHSALRELPRTRFPRAWKLCSDPSIVDTVSF